MIHLRTEKNGWLVRRCAIRDRLTIGSTGAAEAEFVWFLQLLRGGPVNRGVRHYWNQHKMRQDDLVRLERELAIQLPRQYRDFMVAYPFSRSSMGGRPRHSRRCGPFARFKPGET
jgi:hypothetical protein